MPPRESSHLLQSLQGFSKKSLTALGRHRGSGWLGGAMDWVHGHMGSVGRGLGFEGMSGVGHDSAWSGVRMHTVSFESGGFRPSGE